MCGITLFVGFSLFEGFFLYVSLYVCEICPVCGILSCVGFALYVWDLPCVYVIFCLWDLPLYFPCIAISVHQLSHHRVEVGHPPEDCVCGGADQSDAGQHP